MNTLYFSLARQSLKSHVDAATSSVGRTKKEIKWAKRRLYSCVLLNYGCIVEALTFIIDSQRREEEQELSLVVIGLKDALQKEHSKLMRIREVCNNPPRSSTDKRIIAICDEGVTCSD